MMLLTIGLLVTSGSAFAQFVGIPFTRTQAGARKAWTPELSRGEGDKLVLASDPNNSTASSELAIAVAVAWTTLASGAPGAFPQLHH